MKKILIIKWGALGDILASVPTILKIKEQFKDSEITFLSSSISLEIFQKSNIIDYFIDRKKDNMLKTLLYIRKQNFDIVFNLKWGSESADIYALFSNSKIKVGGSKKKYLRYLYDYKPMFTSKDNNRHEYLKNIDILNSYIDVNTTELKSFIYKDENIKIKDFLKDKKRYIVISPSASTLTKAWKEDNYIELSKIIISKYDYDIIITYSPMDEKYCQKISDKIGEKAYLTPKTTINEVAYIVDNALLCICNNSGIMHIAYSVDTPVLCFNTSIGWKPFGLNDISIDRIPKNVKNNRTLNGEQVEKLLNTITVKETFERFEKFHLTIE